MDVGVGRVGLGAIEDDRLEAGRFKLDLDIFGYAHFGQSDVGDDEKVAGAKRLGLGAGLLGAANAHQ